MTKDLIIDELYKIRSNPYDDKRKQQVTDLIEEIRTDTVGLRPIPAEREFWETHDSTDYVDCSKAKRVRFPTRPRQQRVVFVSTKRTTEIPHPGERFGEYIQEFLSNERGDGPWLLENVYELRDGYLAVLSKE